VGKPFITSEDNEPFPNDYAAEMIPIMASYAALQDWDGVFFYSLEPKVRSEARGYIGDHFDLARDPVKLAQLPAGAMIFLRADVKAARQLVARTYSKDQVAEAARMPITEWPYWTPGFPLSLPLRHESRVRCLDCAPTGKFADTADNPIVSDTGELSWRVGRDTHGVAHDGLVTIDSDRSNALVGFIRQNPDAKVRYISADIQNDFAALTLSSLDGKPLARSDRMLLTATARVENTGSVWNKRHTMLQVWGTAPTVIEPVTGWVQLKGLEGAVAVTATALDGDAKPIREIPARYLETSWEFPVGDPVTTTYLIRVVR
ncbi:MAG TPA: hypothetical protein VG798_03250, partial [Rhizomicrobium sp.]|nr:hypothetical protein [Rhizomicrobium sp.]